MQIEVISSDKVRNALFSLGRTEDVKFSPGERRIAIAGFARNTILVVEVKIVVSLVGKRVELIDCVEMQSSSLHGPHGLSFINDETVFVANRFGSVLVLKVPPMGAERSEVSLSPLQSIRGHALRR